MFPMVTEQPYPGAATLCEMLRAARARTLAFAAQLRPEQWLGPCLKIVNPPLWEIGHLGWFQEYWCLRYRPDAVPAPSLLQDADALYNSATVPHAARWHLALPDADRTLAYLHEIFEAVLARIAHEDATGPMRYFAQLALFHEEMHNEAFDYTRQTLGYAAPHSQDESRFEIEMLSGDADIAGGRFLLGAQAGDGFVFDNEKWAHEVLVEPFCMARTAVTQAEFAAFVDDGGYARRKLWSDAGWQWRTEINATMPLYWEKRGAHWHTRRYHHVSPIAPAAPMIHVNWHEAEAYCRWAQRRLPTEAEWEFAAATSPGNLTLKRRYPWGDARPTMTHANLYGVASRLIDVSALPDGDSAWGVRQMFGNVWEWTSTWFEPYPGFVRDPYKEYSEPWFGTHKVLRGGCYATRASLLRNTWRNFYTPERRDVLAGFRTCALD
jgi:iron(II)-dependent oxidoreductase